MAIKISNTTVIDNSRNLTNIQNLNSSGISTIAGSVEISTSGIITATGAVGVLTFYGDGSNLTGVSGGGGTFLTVGRRVGVASVNVASGSTTLLLRTGITTTIPV